MATITYIDPAGGRHDIEAHVGATVMDTAVKNGVPGIVAECGGFLSCASCHVHVDDAWIDTVGRAEDEDEDEILEGRHGRAGCRAVASPARSWWAKSSTVFLSGSHRSSSDERRRDRRGVPRRVSSSRSR